MTAPLPRNAATTFFAALHRDEQWRPPRYPDTTDASWLNELARADSLFTKQNIANAWFWRLNEEAMLIPARSHTAWLAPRSRQYTAFAPHMTKNLFKGSIFSGILEIPSPGGRIPMERATNNKTFIWPFYLRFQQLLHDDKQPRAASLTDMVEKYSQDRNGRFYRDYLSILQHMCWDEVAKQGLRPDISLLKTAITVSVECGSLQVWNEYSHKHPLSQAWETLGSLAQSNKCPGNGPARIAEIKVAIQETPPAICAEMFDKILQRAMGTNAQKESGIHPNTILNMTTKFNKDIYRVLHEWIPQVKWDAFAALGVPYREALQHASQSEPEMAVNLPANMHFSMEDN